MKKIPTLFVREFENHRIKSISAEITPGCEEAFLYGEATVKFDGSCCAIINGEFYKRYDSKKGKKAPFGAIPCCEPDKITDHHPHWVKVDKNNPDDKWFVEAYYTTCMFSNQGLKLKDGTYEAVGVHFQSNPYNYENDGLVKHGTEVVEVERTFDGIKNYLEENNVEGLVFWLNSEPVCKIKRSDFGLPWPVREGYSKPCTT